MTLGIVVAALGVNRLVPAGTAAGTIVTFRLFSRLGVGRQRTGFVMAAQGPGLITFVLVLGDGVWHDRQWLHRLVRQIGGGLGRFSPAVGPDQLDASRRLAP